MKNKKISVLRIVLVALVAALLVFGTLSLTACGKKNATTDRTNSKVTQKKNDNGSITLETSTTVDVKIPKDQQ